MTEERQEPQTPHELYYDKQGHLWIWVEEEIATIGLTSLALETFGDIVYLSTIKADQTVERGHIIGSIEAAKMVDELVSPVSGEIIAFNEAVLRNPGLINDDPSGNWLVKVRPLAWEQDIMTLTHGSLVETGSKE